MSERPSQNLDGLDPELARQIDAVSIQSRRLALCAVVQEGHRLGFDVEPPEVRLGGEPIGRDHLQRNKSIQADLAGEEHDAHAASGDLADDLVIAEAAGE